MGKMHNLIQARELNNKSPLHYITKVHILWDGCKNEKKIFFIDLFIKVKWEFLNFFGALLEYMSFIDLTIEWPYRTTILEKKTLAMSVADKLLPSWLKKFIHSGRATKKIKEFNWENKVWCRLFCTNLLSISLNILIRNGDTITNYISFQSFWHDVFALWITNFIEKSTWLDSC